MWYFFTKSSKYNLINTFVNKSHIIIFTPVWKHFRIDVSLRCYLIHLLMLLNFDLWEEKKLNSRQNIYIHNNSNKEEIVLSIEFPTENQLYDIIWVFILNFNICMSWEYKIGTSYRLIKSKAFLHLGLVRP